MVTKTFKILVSGSAHKMYPSDTLYGLLWYDQDKAIEIPKRYPYSGEWGEILSIQSLINEEYPMPQQLDVIWLSIVERKFYAIQVDLPTAGLEAVWTTYNEFSDFPYTHIVVGLAPYGGVALWFRGLKKSIFLLWMQAVEVNVEMSNFVPANPNISLGEYCDFYINKDTVVRNNLKKNGLPSHNLFDKYMQQFCYRYLPIFERWSDGKGEKLTERGCIPELDYIEEALYDGTHDKLRDGSLLKYHTAGKPKKMTLAWHVSKSEYTAHLWFDENLICAVYDRFYGAHRDTNADLLIHIDYEHRKYELSLYRYGLKEPLRIPEDAYQIIVFKNKFEDYRSDNYDQPRGAWIW